MNDAKREDFRHNFLKKIVVRIDFNGFSESEISSIVTTLKPDLKEYGFDKMEQNELKEIDFKVQDVKTKQDVEVSVSDTRSCMVYSFIDEKNSIKLAISYKFVLVDVNSDKYIDFQKYIKPLIRVVDELKNKDFYCGTRFAIRKINKCLLKDINDLNCFFNEKYFRLHDSKIKLKVHEEKDFYEKGEYNFNLIRSIVRGEYRNEEVYQVTLDTDVYISNNTIINSYFENITNISEMNERLFDVYKETITHEFIEKLKNAEFTDKRIIGVERNV